MCPRSRRSGSASFFPMILIGGVGVPLAVLPVWAQRVAGFHAGAICRGGAATLLHPALNGLRRRRIPIGGAGGDRTGGGSCRGEAVPVGAGPKERARRDGGWRRRWPPGSPSARSPGRTGRLQPVLPEAAAWTEITEAQIAEIGFDGLPAIRRYRRGPGARLLRIRRRPGTSRPSWRSGSRGNSTMPGRAFATWCRLRRSRICVPIREKRRLPGWCFGRSASRFDAGVGASGAGLDDSEPRRRRGGPEGSGTGAVPASS